MNTFSKIFYKMIINALVFYFSSSKYFFNVIFYY